MLGIFEKQVHSLPPEFPHGTGCDTPVERREGGTCTKSGICTSSKTFPLVANYTPHPKLKRKLRTVPSRILLLLAGWAPQKHRALPI